MDFVVQNNESSATLEDKSKISVNIPTTSKPRVVVIGGGFAGLEFYAQQPGGAAGSIFRLLDSFPGLLRDGRGKPFPL